MFVKEARKPSSDPVQEKLRQTKASFNKRCSVFINDLIHFKKLMNGAPNEFFKEKSKITEPIPADPVTIIGVLASDFQTLATEANSIIREQIEYSKNRKKSQPKQNNQPVNLGQQLAANDHSYYLISEASNPLSRFFARLLSPSTGDKGRIKKYRMSLLTAAVDLNKDLKRLQAVITGSGPESIFAASKIIDKIENNWSFILAGLNAYQSTLGNTVNQEGGNINAPVTTTTAPSDSTKIIDPQIIDNILKDFQKNADNFIDLDTSELWALNVKYNDEANKNKAELIPQINRAYQDLLTKAKAQYQVQGNTLAEILNNKNNPAKKSADSLETVAQNVVDKWFGKMKHQLSPFDKTSAFRLDIYHIADNCMKVMDKVMDSLEKELNPQFLSTELGAMNKEIFKIKELMKALNATVHGRDFTSSFTNMLGDGTLGDSSVRLDKMQQEKLKKLLQHKQLQDLSKMYANKK
jgi:hypothetical protein